MNSAKHRVVARDVPDSGYAREHNQNLAHLEQRLDVSLNSFGNSIKINGKADAVKRTQSVLENMYRTINETGIEALQASLIDDVVRWTENGADAPVATGASAPFSVQRTTSSIKDA